MKKVTWIALTLVLLSGCANLADVRQFAGDAARLTGYQELTLRFRDTYERERPFLGPSGHCDIARAQTQNAWRQAAYPDLIKMSDRLSQYMGTLAALAGDTAFSLSPSIDRLHGTIVQQPGNLGLETAQVEAYTQLGKILAGMTTQVLQEKAIRETVTAADPSVQTLVQGLGLMLDAYAISNSNERGCVLDFVKQQSTLAARSPNGALLGAIGLSFAHDKEVEYDRAATAIADTKKAVAAIGVGHSALRKNVNNLTGTELVAALKQVNQTIAQARVALKSLNQ